MSLPAALAFTEDELLESAGFGRSGFETLADALEEGLVK